MRYIAAAILVGLFAAPVAAGQTPVGHYRIVASATGAALDLSALATLVARADVVFLGEQHDDLVGHQVQRGLLEAIAAERTQVVLALEMFERDVQEPLDHFQMGHTEEPEFLAEARPWPQYQRDYKPLVDFAIARTWPVVAANVPRAIAADVAAAGLASLTSLSETQRRLVATDLQCEPSGDYFRRFLEVLGSHGQTLDEVDRRRYYEAQCVKDETMAESISQAHAAGSIGGKRPLVISVNGVAHVDYRLGTVERVARRLPGKAIVTVTIVPVANPQTATATADLAARADYLIFTARP